MSKSPAKIFGKADSSYFLRLKGGGPLEGVEFLMPVEPVNQGRGGLFDDRVYIRSAGGELYDVTAYVEKREDNAN